MLNANRDWSERLDYEGGDCLTMVCPQCSLEMEAPDCESCGYVVGDEVTAGAEPKDGEQGECCHYLGTTEKVPSVADGGEEKFFPGRNTPEQSSQPSQCSHDPGLDVEAMIEAATEPTDPKAEELAAAVATLEKAIAECQDNPGVLASVAFNDAAQRVRESDPEEWFRLRVALKRAKPSGVLLGDIDKASRPASEAADEGTIADDLVALVLEAGQLFHAPDGAAFVTVADGAADKTFKLDTKAFDDWLSYAFFSKTEEESGKGCAASDTAIRTAKTALTGIARHRGDEIPVYLRAAPWQNGYVIDLGADDWRVIEVLPTGWRILDKSPVKFWRPAPLRPLPVPTAGGDLARLWEFANIPDAVRPLALACALESWRPDTPFPILELIGAQGTAKSSTQDKWRRLIDPNAVNLRSAPKTTEDLFVGAGCNWLVSLNNLSHLSAQQQDALCNLATGGGFAGRTLYTNSDETLIECKRPVVINGIVPLVTAQDLTDRVIHVELEPIEYRDETEIEAAFGEAAPAILGGLLDLFVITLAKLPEVKPARLPRMGDFAKLGEAMFQAQGRTPGAFIDLYNENRKQSVARGLDASPVAAAVREMAEATRNEMVFDGTMKRLLEALEQYRDASEAWPRTPRGLGDVLRRQAPALKTVGLEITIGKAGREGVPVKIRRCEHCEHREGHSEVFRRGKNFSAESGTIEVTV